MATIRRAGPSADDDLANALAEVPQRRRFTSHYDRDDDGTVDGPNELSILDHILFSPALARRVREVHTVHSHDPAEVSDHWPVVVTIAE